MSIYDSSSSANIAYGYSVKDPSKVEDKLGENFNLEIIEYAFDEEPLYFLAIEGTHRIKILDALGNDSSLAIKESTLAIDPKELILGEDELLKAKQDCVELGIPDIVENGNWALFGAVYSI